MTRDNFLIVGDSEHDANMLYAVRMFVPDPFIYARIKGKCHIIINDLELDRARKHARHCRINSLTQSLQKLRRDSPKSATMAGVIRTFLKEHRLRKVVVPDNFPVGLAKELRRLKVKIKVKKGPFFRREIKSAEEIKKISAALMMAEVGLAEGIHALKNSRIGKGGRLIHRNLPLTSERLRSIIDIAIIQAGGLASHTVVAGGKQACDPHERGYGPLWANQPIILHVFPRSQKTGYFGDITRTIVRGRASEAVRKIYHSVARAQEIVFEQLRPGKIGLHIHKAVQDLFDGRGYKTCRQNGRMEGFFHGTGHGLGLEVQEAPRISATSNDLLVSGHVVTVEPGLYYRHLGGVRLEDVALVTFRGPRNLTKFEKVLEL